MFKLIFFVPMLTLSIVLFWKEYGWVNILYFMSITTILTWLSFKFRTVNAWSNTLFTFSHNNIVPLFVFIVFVYFIINIVTFKSWRKVRRDAGM